MHANNALTDLPNNWSGCMDVVWKIIIHRYLCTIPAYWPRKFFMEYYLLSSRWLLYLHWGWRGLHLVHGAWQRLNPGLNINKSFIIMGNVFYLWGLGGWASAGPPHCLYLTFHRPVPSSSAFNASCLRTMENFNFKLSLIKTSESFPEGYVRKKGFLIS